ncbi:MAG: holin [Streptomyces sp.]|nr:holin [Streptomyces sp.]
MSAPIERKVMASTAMATVVGAFVTILNAAVGNSQLMGSLPGWLQGLLTLVGPPLAVFLAGYAAPHTSRVTAAPVSPASGGASPAA